MLCNENMQIEKIRTCKSFCCNITYQFSLMYKNIPHSLEVADNSVDTLKGCCTTVDPKKPHPVTTHIIIFTVF